MQGKGAGENKGSPEASVSDVIISESYRLYSSVQLFIYK